MFDKKEESVKKKWKRAEVRNHLQSICAMSDVEREAEQPEINFIFVCYEF